MDNSYTFEPFLAEYKQTKYKDGEWVSISVVVQIISVSNTTALVIYTHDAMVQKNGWEHVFKGQLDTIPISMLKKLGAD